MQSGDQASEVSEHSVSDRKIKTVSAAELREALNYPNTKESKAVMQRLNSYVIRVVGRQFGTSSHFPAYSDARRNMVEEVAQKTLIKVVTSFEQFRSEAQLSTWIGTIAKNTLNNEISRGQRRLELQKNNLEQGQEELMGEHQALDENEIIARLDTARLRSLVAQLPEHLRRVVHLKMEGLDDQTIADQIDKSRRMVGNYFNQAQTELRKLMVGESDL